jgi:hypothetical protein
MLINMPIEHFVQRQSSPCYFEDHQDISIPFLPLPPTFDQHDRSNWAELANSIQEWLIGVVHDTNCPEWKWGRDAFWISFIAAHPSFPDGDWPVWHPKISMQGPFISSWFEAAENGEPYSARSTIDLWYEFQHHVLAFRP